MPTVVAPRLIRLTSPDSSAVITLKPGVPRDLNEFWATEAKRRGAQYVGAEAPVEAPAAPPADRVAALVDAIRVVYASGDKKKLTATGEVRAKALEEITGFASTADERAEAQALYDAEYGGD